MNFYRKNSWAETNHFENSSDLSVTCDLCDISSILGPLWPVNDELIEMVQQMERGAIDGEHWEGWAWAMRIGNNWNKESPPFRSEGNSFLKKNGQTAK